MSRVNATLQRLERILVMVPWLLEHPGVAVEEVEEQFGVSRDDLAQDLDVLGYCGLPGYGGGDLVEASIVGGRVTVRMADFFRRPLALSLHQAVALLLAGRALAAVEGLPESASLRSAVRKLEAALRVEPGVQVDLGAPGDELLPALREALTDRRVVRLTYRSGSKAQMSEREVEPWGVTAAQGAWYLQGYCRSAQGARAFRLDRIARLETTTEPAPEPPAELRQPAYQPAEGDIEVVLDLRAEAWWVADWLVLDDIEERAEGVRRVRLRTPHVEWLARLALRLGPHATVVAPPALRRRVAQLAEQTLAHYADG